MLKKIILIILLLKVVSIYADPSLSELKYESGVIVKYNITSLEDESEKNIYKMELVSTGTFLSPGRKLTENYKSLYGFELGISVNDRETRKKTTFPISKFSYILFKDNFEIKNKTMNTLSSAGSSIATIDGIYFGMDDSFSLYTNKEFEIKPLIGGGFGGATFSLNSKTFNALSENTLTELKNENTDFQLYHFNRFGVDMKTSEHVTISCTYDLASIERATNPDRVLFSGMLFWFSKSIIMDGTYKIGLIESNKIRKLTSFIMTTGFLFIWDNNTYKKQLEWPFNNDPALKYHKNRVSMRYEF